MLRSGENDMNCSAMLPQNSRHVRTLYLLTLSLRLCPASVRMRGGSVTEKMVYIARARISPFNLSLRPPACSPY